jgi:hypothetical protein
MFWKGASKGTAAEAPSADATVVVVHSPWREETEIVSFPDANHTVLELAQSISAMLGVPASTLRLLLRGQNLDDMSKTLASAGFTVGGVTPIAVLHPKRDERGPVLFKFRDGAEVLRLEMGEWNCQTSFTTLRPIVAKAANALNVSLVYEGLTLPDGASFAQCGIHAFSVVSVFKEKTAPPKTVAPNPS